VEAPPGVLAYRRDDHLIAINTSGEDSRVPVFGEAVLETTPGALRDRTLAAHSGVITRRDYGV
jgi:hypothetical protein